MEYKEIKDYGQLTAKDLIFSGEENSKWARLFSEIIDKLNKRLQEIEPYCIG